MCGIIAVLDDKISQNKKLQDLKLQIDRRGPDYSSKLEPVKTECDLKLHLYASVLHLRGRVMQRQPVIDQSNNCLVFNGQIYEFNSHPLDETTSDTTFLFGKLNSCQRREEIGETLASIDGPFAFVYWSAKFKSLFYGRDLFGRKSLCLFKKIDQESLPLIISSVAMVDHNQHLPSDCYWSEVDCSGFHCIDFSGNKPKTMILGWQLDKIYPKTSKCDNTERAGNNEYLAIKQVPLDPLNQTEQEWSTFSTASHKDACIEFGDRLIEAVGKRVRYNRKDCLICRRQTKVEPAAAAMKCKHSQICVAFSGGIDSTMIALALDKVLDKSDTVDLSSVAFKEDSPDRESVGKAFREIRKLCPDRNWRLILADIQADKLRQAREETIADLISPCKTVIDDSLGCGCWFIGRARGRAFESRLVDGEFEESLKKFLEYQPENEEDTICVSPASMIFAGMSIDEQLGGYSSHRAAWCRGRSRSVIEEISFQMRRLSRRNLGRDDRCFSQHGRDVKLPYLDHKLVSYLNRLPLGLKMDLDGEASFGPKRILRELAASWGLEETSTRIKRALQFGTRIANLEDAREKGSDLCSRLRMAHQRAHH